MTTSMVEPTLAPVARPRVPRAIVHRTRGQTYGPITRLVSPADLGELIKPFVFLDSFAMKPGSFPGFGWHPHSGIATVSVILEGAVSYEETTGAKGVLHAGAVEWMRAGNGVWHTGAPSGHDPIVGFQLWVALPADLENGPSESHYLKPEDVPREGPVRVILGSHGVAKSPVKAPPGMNYFVVELKARERWTYQPPPGHTVGWVAVQSGVVQTPERVSRGELAVLAASNEPLDFVAEWDTRFVLGSAVPHPHDLVLGRYSVHTNTAALAKGEQEILRIHRDSPVVSKVRR